VELLHRILDDLPIISVLKLLAERNIKIQEGILSHLHYRSLFNARNVVDIIEVFVFVGISTSLKGPLFTLDRHPHSSLRELEWGP